VSQGLRQYLAPDHVLIYLRMIHPLLAVGAVVVLFKLAAEGRRTPGVAVIRGMAAALGALTAIQLLIGPLTIALLQPVGLRVFHLFLADLLWLAVVFLGAAILEEPHGDARPEGRLEAARDRRRP
jgi:heme A synthase